MGKRILYGVLCSCLAAAGVASADSATGEGTTKAERQAFFEASQTVLRILTCVAEAVNADGDTSRTTDAAACFRKLIDPNITADFDGFRLNGIDELLGFLVFGPGATSRTNLSFGSFTPRAGMIKAGARPGTGTVRVEFFDTAFFEVVAPGPFGVELGPLFIKDQDSLTLVATRPGEWRIVNRVVRRVVTESRPGAVFPSPFPAFGSHPDIE